jgi:IS5 family transposase
MREFIGIDLGRQQVPDGTTLLKFRRKLEDSKLTEAIFREVASLRRIQLASAGCDCGTTVLISGSLALDDVVRSHYNSGMKTATIPQIRVEPELRADLDSVLLPGETLTAFVEASVRNAVEFRRVQSDFAARCDASLAEFERTGISIPADVVLSKLEAKVAARVKQLPK